MKSQNVTIYIASAWQISGEPIVVLRETLPGVLTTAAVEIRAADGAEAKLRFRAWRDAIADGVTGYDLDEILGWDRHEIMAENQRLGCASVVAAEK